MTVKTAHERQKPGLLGVQETFERTYAKFSVALDEALGMHTVGREGQANQLLTVSPGLCNRLSSPLRCL
jgi:hypothetical protein